MKFFCGIDSDDYLTDNALELVSSLWKKADEHDDCIGMCFLNYKKGTTEVIGSKFPENEMFDTYYNIYNKYSVTGDKELIFKTEIAKKYPYPKIDEEKFVPESLLFNRMSKDYKLVFVNEAIIEKTYTEQGYSNNYFELCKRNPKGNALYYKELYDFEKGLYNVAAYDMFCMFSKMSFKDTIMEHPSPFKAFLMYVPAFIKYKQKL